jgi:hypothetical protein
MFRLYQAIIRGSKVYMYLTYINSSNNVTYHTQNSFVITNRLQQWFQTGVRVPPGVPEDILGRTQNKKKINILFHDKH